MRLILPAGLILMLIVLACGCVQSPPAQVTPAPPATFSVAVVPDTTNAPPAARVANVSAVRLQNSVVVRLDGGKDAGSLTSLVVHINNQDGTTVDRTIGAPEIGRDYSIQYFRTANAATANIIGTFADGYQQTLLITSL